MGGNPCRATCVFPTPRSQKSRNERPAIFILSHYRNTLKKIGMHVVLVGMHRLSYGGAYIATSCVRVYGLLALNCKLGRRCTAPRRASEGARDMCISPSPRTSSCRA